MSYGNGIKLTAGFDVGAKTPLDSKSVVQTIAERDAFVTDNLAYEGLEVYVKETKIKYRYDGTSWIDLDTQSGSESGTGEGLTTEQANQLTTAYEHSQTPHVSVDDIPTKTSDLTNDSGFITSIPSEYITETELETKGYLTEHQSLTDYAKKTDIPDVSDFLTEVPTEYVTDTELSTELDKKVNKEVGKGLSTNDLTNELVTKINSSATEAFVTNAIANAQLGDKEVDLSGYATVDALKLKADSTHTHDEYLTKVPDEYITETELNAKGYLTEHQDISNLALKSEIPDVSSFITSDDLPTVPTKVSDLANDKNYISSIPSEYVTETELTAKKYLTSHQDISGLQTKTDNNLATDSKEVVGAINEVKDMADLILDTEVRLDKTHSSSKIYSDIQDAMDSSKNFTLAEIGKMSGASYKVVTSIAEMTDGKIIYLLKNGATYDMYIVETVGTATKIGDTAIDLSSYLKVADAESAYLKKTEATITYTTQTSFNNHINDTVAHLTQLEKNKLLTTDNISANINSSSDSIQVPSAKAVYNLSNTKADANHTHNTSDIKGLSIPTKVGDLENDRGYLTSIPEEYITETELNAKGYLTSHQDISNLQSKTDNNLTTTSKEVVGAINEVKSLNDTKLNKTDANKLNCVSIDNVSLKEYILTNFTETEKTYHLIAKTTCTDLPKASNFFITVETPGLYTYKVTAKELNDSNGRYVCTYRTISSSWTEWEKVLTGDITDTIDINSSGTKIPNVKAVYNDIIIGKDIDQTVIDTYGTEILKYPLGIWRFGTVGTANKFSDLPVKTGGRIEITSIKADTNSNPWNSSWAYRVYNFETFTGMNYCRKVTSTDTPGIGSDTGWQKVCTTTVADVGVTTITPVNSAITGTIEYTVKNGICYVSMKNLMSTISSTGLLISTTMPKPSVNCNAVSVNSSGNVATIYIDKNTTKLNGDFYEKNAKSNCSFSYPVAEP